MDATGTTEPAIATCVLRLVDSRFRGYEVQGRTLYAGNGLPCGCPRPEGGSSLGVRSSEAVALNRLVVTVWWRVEQGNFVWLLARGGRSLHMKELYYFERGTGHSPQRRQHYPAARFRGLPVRSE